MGDSEQAQIIPVEEEIGEIQESPKMEPEDVSDPKKQDNSNDQSSPRGVLEIPVSGTDSDNSSCSSCSSSSNDKSVVQQELVRDNNWPQWKNLIGSLKKKSIRRFSTIPLLATHELSRMSLRRKLARIRSSDDGISSENIPVPKPSWRSFDYAELAAATDNFNPENLIGKGGHADVYKGCLSDGQLVAIKKLTKNEKEDEERTGDFLSELGIIAHINHPNAARLIGFSVEGGLHLVLQFSPQGSLASVLHGTTKSLDWKTRFKVAVGIAAGLQYLHQGCSRRIIHRDIKASNILLTEDYEPQISDFGLAKWLPDKWTQHVVFPIEGTFGYLAPEYFMHGIVDEKTDVFAFGVLLLEIITGRHAVDSSRQSLAIWAKPLLDSNDYKELADPRLGDNYDVGEMKRAMLIASMCIHHSSSMRPEMNRVAQLLRGEEKSPELKQKSSSGRAVILDDSDLETYTCTSYLNDLNRHMELVME